MLEKNFPLFLSSCYVTIGKNKEVQYCEYAHKVPTPLTRILDLIGYQMMEKIDDSLKHAYRSENGHETQQYHARGLMEVVDNRTTRQDNKKPNIFLPKLDVYRKNMTKIKLASDKT